LKFKFCRGAVEKAKKKSGGTGGLVPQWGAGAKPLLVPPRTPSDFFFRLGKKNQEAELSASQLAEGKQSKMLRRKALPDAELKSEPPCGRVRESQKTQPTGAFLGCPHEKQKREQNAKKRQNATDLLPPRQKVRFGAFFLRFVAFAFLSFLWEGLAGGESPRPQNPN